jgi:hypothetical protein
MTAPSRKSHQILAASMLALLTFSLGCASQSSSGQSTQAIQAAQEIPQEELLDVGITIFDPGLPPEGQPVPDDVFPELRKAESRFQAIRLMETMQSTGQWGAVRVLPAGHGTTDLRVSGTILLSTGLKLALDIEAVDARGKVWLERRYRAQADETVYGQREFAARPLPVGLQRDLQRSLAGEEKAPRRRAARNPAGIEVAVRRQLGAGAVRGLSDR